jgi:threonine/homoserine/homoserine lactone efflux protein
VAYLVWIGIRLAFSRPGSALPIDIRPGRYFKQAFFITLLNPKAIVFYMAFFPLFIDPAAHQGVLTFAAMAVTIAALSLAYCLLLAGFAHAVAEKVRAHRRAVHWLERFAGFFLVGFGLKLAQ